MRRGEWHWPVPAVMLLRSIAMMTSKYTRAIEGVDRPHGILLGCYVRQLRRNRAAPAKALQQATAVEICRWVAGLHFYRCAVPGQSHVRTTQLVCRERSVVHRPSVIRSQRDGAVVVLDRRLIPALRDGATCLVRTPSMRLACRAADKRRRARSNRAAFAGTTCTYEHCCAVRPHALTTTPHHHNSGCVGGSGRRMTWCAPAAAAGKGPRTILRREKPRL